MNAEEEKRKAEEEAMRKKTGESRIEPISDDELEVENGFFTVGDDDNIVEISRGDKKETDDE